MQIFTKYFTHSVRILELFEATDKLISVREMSEAGAPRSFAVKIMAQLTKLGCVKAKEGRNGGYKLVGSGRSALMKLFGEQSWAKAKNILS